MRRSTAYRWCGYAQAVDGDETAIGAFQWLAGVDPHGGRRTDETEPPSAAEALRRWRCFLFGIPDQASRQTEEAAKGEKAHVSRRRISRKKALQVLAEGGRLPEADILRCKNRYFTDGGAVGGKEFVEGVFEASRDRFSPKRKQGPHPVRGLAAESSAEKLFNLRQLQKKVFE